MKKILIICILTLGFGITNGFSQSKKMKEKATELVAEINAEIQLGDSSQELTETQKEIIYKIHIKRLMALKEVRKEGGEKDDRKEINKKYFQQINKEVLTKKQRQAKKAGKETKD